MASYNAPENFAIFDQLAFSSNNQYVTYTDGIKKYLTFPLAQGKQTLLNVDISGNINQLTASAGHTPATNNIFNNTTFRTINAPQGSTRTLILLDASSSNSLSYALNASAGNYGRIARNNDVVFTSSSITGGLSIAQNSIINNGLRIDTNLTQNIMIGYGGNAIGVDPTNNITINSSNVSITSTNAATLNGTLNVTNGVLTTTISPAGINVADKNDNVTYYPTFVNGTGQQSLFVDATTGTLNYNPSTRIMNTNITAPTQVETPLVQNLLGNLELKVNTSGVGGSVILTGGTNLLSPTASGSAGQHLVLTINGTIYKIKLENA